MRIFGSCGVRRTLTVTTAYLLVAVFFGTALTSSAFADPAAELAEAQTEISALQSAVAESEGDIASGKQSQEAAQRKLDTTAAIAERLEVRASSAEERHERMVNDRLAEQEKAAEEVSALRANAAEERDAWQSSRVASAFFAGLLLLPLLAGLFWRRLKQGGFWPRLTSLDAGRKWLVTAAPAVAFGLVGWAVASVGVDVPEILGLGIVGLGLGGTMTAVISLLLIDPAYQGLRSKVKLPSAAKRGIRYGLVALLGLLTMASVAAAADSEEPASKHPSAQTLLLADGDKATIDASPEIIAVSRAAERLRTQADHAEARRARASDALAPITAALIAARTTLRQDERKINRLENRSDALQDEIDAAAAAAAEQAAKEAEEAAMQEPTSSSGCDPNYSGCVPPYPPDVNCADVDGPVTVLGSDPHGLDRDGDGVGCE